MIVMSSVKWSANGWNTAPTRLAVLIGIVLQALGPGAGWTQEPVQPKIDEEFAKQEKIYRRRGADVPGSYVTNRGLSRYSEVLPTGFCDALANLGTSDRWRVGPDPESSGVHGGGSSRQAIPIGAVDR